MTDFFFSQDRLLAYSPIRKAYFLTFVAFYLLTEMGRQIYRPYIYGHSIDDYGFADVVGNLLGTVAIIFFDLAVVHATRTQGPRLVVFVTAGVAVYELLQAVLPRGVLDWKDVIATPIGGILALVLFLAIWRVKGDEKADQPKRSAASGGELA